MSWIILFMITNLHKLYLLTTVIILLNIFHFESQLIKKKVMQLKKLPIGKF